MSGQYLWDWLTFHGRRLTIELIDGRTIDAIGEYLWMNTDGSPRLLDVIIDGIPKSIPIGAVVTIADWYHRPEPEPRRQAPKIPSVGSHGKG